MQSRRSAEIPCVKTWYRYLARASRSPAAAAAVWMGVCTNENDGGQTDSMSFRICANVVYDERTC